MNFIKSKSGIVFFHLMVWLLLFSLPYLLSSGQSQEIRNVIVHSWIPLSLYAVLFYLNYFVLVDRFLFEKKMVLYIVVNVILIVLFVWLNGKIREVFFAEFLANEKLDLKKPPRKFFIYIDMIAFGVPVVFSLALKTIQRWGKTEAERVEAANIKLQSELQHLKYQLQPHFFFNSLNNIYSLVDISPDMAKQTIHSLGKLMRYLLYETNNEKVSLKNEINFMTNYIELMKLRLYENTTVQYSFPDLKTDIQIAPLLFISLIENAFKHGVSADKASAIVFEMKIEDKQLKFYSENQNFPKTDVDKSGSGIGLDNVEKRLSLLYPDQFSFIEKVEEGVFSVCLKIEV
ncbi:sensor histidine kinase [Flavobacterium frigidarium]|uniref:sensor histidine kinase n=1 Tax=Flavobacterium frigidarium TaxID=99286 RepID=UPI00047BE454|nr:histidine kinase [Flavobacterium frigidarium]